MSFLRIFLATIINFYLEISSQSPNQEAELGTKDGDIIVTNGKIGNMIKHARKFFIPMALMLYGYHYMNEPLLMIEYIYFVLATAGIALRVWSFKTLKYYFTFS